MIWTLSSTTTLQRRSPVSAGSPGQPAPQPPVPQEEASFRQSESSGPPRWLMVALAGVALAGSAAGMAQVQLATQPEQLSDTMQLLEESSAKQGIQLEFLLPSPFGGGRPISNQDAARELAEGNRVLLAEVTSVSGPFRTSEPIEVRREAYLTGAEDLESYARYFTGAEAQNPTERAAQQLKKHIFEQQELTLLQRPGARPGRPTLSPFEAARRLEAEQTVVVSRQPDGVVRTEAVEVELNQLSDVDDLVKPCDTFINFQMGADGTLQLVEQRDCSTNR